MDRLPDNIERFLNAAEVSDPKPSKKDSHSSPCSPVSSEELWNLRQQVLGLGMGDPWDGEELEGGYVRPIPEGFEDEVAKFDAMHSKEIKRTNECLAVISELAMRQSRWENQ